MRGIVHYLEMDLRQSIVNDVRDVACFHAHPRRKANVEGGYFSIPREVFCYVDYLGQIAFDSRSGTERAENFIKTYFSPKYGEYAELIYSMWRHGPVHEYKPKTYYADYQSQSPRRIKVYWLSNNDNRKGTRKEHLKFFSMQGKRATLYLCVNICQLVDDLLDALAKFVVALKSNASLRRDSQARLNNIRQTSSLTCIQRQASRDAVGRQILLAWQNKSRRKID